MPRQQGNLQEFPSQANELSAYKNRTLFSEQSIVYPWTSPIPVVFVEGDSAEMGKEFAHATKSITRKNVAFNVPRLKEILEKARVKPRDYVRGIEAAIRKFTTSDYLDEMQSIADAAKLPYESIVLLNSNIDIITALSAPGSGDRFFCSMFAAWGKATSGSRTIAGHNDDGNRIMDQYAVLKIAKPRKGHAFVCPQVPGYLGYDCFVNSAQMFVCGTAVDDRMKDSEILKEGVPNWALYRWIGQFADSVKDASNRLLSSTSMTLKNWCFVGKGEGVVIEATPRHHANMKLPRSNNWIGLSTCTVCPELSKYTVKSKNKTSGQYRIVSVRKEVSQRYGRIDSNSGISILSSHYDSMRKRTVASEHTPCRHMEFEGRFAGTCRSLVATFNEKNDQGSRSTNIDVALGNPCSSYWRRLQFNDKFDLVAGYNKNDASECKLNELLILL